MKKYSLLSFLILLNLYCSEKKLTLLQSLKELRRTLLHEVEALYDVRLGDASPSFVVVEDDIIVVEDVKANKVLSKRAKKSFAKAGASLVPQERLSYFSISDQELIKRYKKAYALLGTLSVAKIRNLFHGMVEDDSDKEMTVYDSGRVLVTFDSTMIPRSYAIYETIRAKKFRQAPPGGIATFIGNGKRKKRST